MIMEKALVSERERHDMATTAAVRDANAAREAAEAEVVTAREQLKIGSMAFLASTERRGALLGQRRCMRPLRRNGLALAMHALSTSVRNAVVLVDLD